MENLKGFEQNASFSNSEKKVIESRAPNTLEVQLDQKSFHITMFPIIDSQDTLISTGCIVADQSKSLKQAEKDIQHHMALLESIGKTQSQFMSARSRAESFKFLLNTFIDMTESEFGFIGEIYQDD